MPSKHEKEIVDCERKVTKSTNERKTAEEKLQENLLKLKDKIDPLTTEKATLEQELVDVKVRNDEADSQLKCVEKELELTRRNETDAKRKYDMFRESATETKESLKERKAKLAEYEEEIPKIKEEMVECEKIIADSKKKEGELRIKVNEMRSVVEEKTHTIQQARSNSRVADFLMKKKMNGELPGIFGRLVRISLNNAIKTYSIF